MFSSLPGFRDFYPADCLKRNYLFSAFSEAAEAFYFQGYDAPVLEPLELFTQKSGDEIVSQLFSFSDQGGRDVALRPELTPSLARMVGSQANSLPKPVKWYTIGENFRYERPQKGRLRSFYQFNADIFGIDSYTADAECIALITFALQKLGLTSKHFTVKLSDRTLWMAILEHWGLTDDKAEQALAVVDRLDKHEHSELIPKLEPLLGTESQNFLAEMEQLRAISSLDALKAYLADFNIDGLQDRLAEWQGLLDELHALGLADFISIDLGVVRGLAYYTGFVFEVFQTIGKGRALAGGGRYDNLVEKLGGPPLHAVGFAIGDVTLSNLLEELDLFPDLSSSPEIAFVIDSNPELRPQALSAAMALRNNGFFVDFPLKSTNFNKQFKQAHNKTPQSLVIFANDLDPGMVKVKVTESGQELVVSLDELPGLFE